MTERGASDLDVQSSTAITFDEVHQAALHRSADWLRDMGTSQATAYEVLSKVFLWNRVQLWLKEDMKAVLASQPRGVKKGPFLALQIDGAAKRGGEAEDDFWLIEVELYLALAKSSLASSTEIRAEDVRGVWVSSSDGTATEEVKDLVQRYFPAVGPDQVGWISLGRSEWDEGGLPNNAVASSPEYERIVREMADLLLMSRAALFVGHSGNSDVCRIVALLRTHRQVPPATAVYVEQ
ncbi:unnamed protein product [Sphacelaria rigidula]